VDASCLSAFSYSQRSYGPRGYSVDFCTPRRKDLFAPSLFAYLVEQAEREGEPLSSMIVDILYKDYDLHPADPSLSSVEV
jgi:hypothetical protein